jgi:hypothetical protein
MSQTFFLILDYQVKPLGLVVQPLRVPRNKQVTYSLSQK